MSNWVDRCTEGKSTTILGPPRVNVLLLNLALDHPELAQDRSGDAGLSDVELTRWPKTTH